MVSQMTHTLLYMIFALLWVLFNYQQRIHVASEMYNAAISHFLTTPWDRNPDRRMEDVRNGPEVYRWLSDVFVNEVYNELPRNGDRQGYCSDSFPCLMMEGDADQNLQCAAYLQNGNNNCPTYMMSRLIDCCDACGIPDVEVEGYGDPAICPNFTYSTDLPDNPATVKSTNVDNLGQACDTANDGMPSWIDSIESFVSGSSHIDADESQDSFTFCPERLARSPRSPENLPLEANLNNRNLMIRGYNRVLSGRLSLKKMERVHHDSTRFKNAYPMMPASETLNPAMRSDAEDTRPFGSAGSLYMYSEDGGFKSAGGYVQMIDFSKNRDELRMEMDKLNQDGWFDLSQGTLVLEVIIYNGNQDLFLYNAFQFQHTFGGLSKTAVLSIPMNLSFWSLHTVLTILLFFGCIFLWVFFVMNEVAELSTDPHTYLKYPVSATWKLITYLLIGCCLMIYLWVVLNPYFRNFMLLRSPSEQEQKSQFEELDKLFRYLDVFYILTSINTCLVCIKFLSLMASLDPRWGIVFATIDESKENLCSFFGIFIVLFFGFTVAAWFIFGTRLDDFGTLPHAILACFMMVMGHSQHSQLNKGDPMMSTSFFIIFHFFFTVVLNIFLAIVICGYVKTRERLDKNSNAGKSTLRLFFNRAKASIMEKLGPVFKVMSALNQILLGSKTGATLRVNYELINRLRDRRKTRPRLRNVEYEKKTDDMGGLEPIKPQNDLVLDWGEPYYPGGFMNIFVKKTTKDGRAEECKVLQDYHLVGIQKKNGSIIDRTDFRKRDKFFGLGDFKGGDHFGGDPNKILRVFTENQFPITLDFEGSMPAVSCECIMLFLYMVVFMIYIVIAARTQDSYHLMRTHETVLRNTKWYEYSPTRVRSFDNIDSMPQVFEWMKSTVLDGEYECMMNMESAYSEERGCDSEDYVRKDWIWWAGPAPAGNRFSNPMMTPLAEIPPSMEGWSGAYMTKTNVETPEFGERPNNTVADVLPQMHSWNIGVMPNNHVRVTFQFACFTLNTQTKYKEGYKLKVHDIVLANNPCGENECMKREIEQLDEPDGLECRDFEGDETDLKTRLGFWSNISFKYTDTRSYRGKGGVSVGLGNTREEAKWVVDLLQSDQLISGPMTASIVIDWVNYNANLDMFTYTYVRFSRQPSGRLDKDMSTNAFPLNLWSQGQQQSATQTTCMLMFIAYFTLTMYWFIATIRNLWTQFQITTELQRAWYKTFLDFFTDDGWHVIDITSLALNFVVISYTIYFACLEPSLSISTMKFEFNTWTLTWKWEKLADRDSVDIIDKFELAATLYNSMLFYAGLNSFFLIVRVIKYIRAIPPLGLVMETLAGALKDISFVALNLVVLMVGFVFLFFTLFGVIFLRFGSWVEAFKTLFLYMLGEFDVVDVYNFWPIGFITCFMVYQFLFFFMLTNVFLAAIAHQWKVSRMFAQESKLVKPMIQSIGKGLRWMCVLCCSRHGAQAMASPEEENEKVAVKLDAVFWRSCSILNHLADLDETGAINVVTDAKLGKNGVKTKHQKHLKGEALKDGDEIHISTDEKMEERTEKEMLAHGVGGGAMEDGEPQKFEHVFRRAHMEIASGLSRSVVAPPPGSGGADTGAGVGAVEEDAEQDPDEIDDRRRREEKEDHYEIGIIEDDVESEVADRIRERMLKMLSDRDHVADEIWLDAIITVLEEAGALKRVQQLFLPPAMSRPKKPQEWGHFNAKKSTMEKRLDTFLQMVMEATKQRHYHFLSDSATAKERVLKQQTLVLVNYLEHLDAQVAKLQDEIKKLETKNMRIRGHVQPLLNPGN